MEGWASKTWRNKASRKGRVTIEGQPEREILQVRGLQFASFISFSIFFLMKKKMMDSLSKTYSFEKREVTH